MDPPPYSEKGGLQSPLSRAVTIQVLTVQSQQGHINTTVRPPNEPDYLAFSIFTMLCCCLPLGIAALVFSILTQQANNTGHATDAQRYSRTARILAYIALGVGILFAITYIPILVVFSRKGSD